ncbi:MAG: histidinol-phosphate transaminase [Coriobacteriia bacterium]|nr:histidinol-phosphate transaminase [Coriobacteriia bacterium]
MKRIRDPRPGLESLVPYDAKDIKADVILASNEHPSNLPGEILDWLSTRIERFQFNRYPDPTARELRALIAEANGLDEPNVLVGNGGDELIFDILAAWGGPGRTLIDLPPTFAMYAIDAQITGTNIVSIPRDDSFAVDADAVLERLGRGDVDIIMIANPNNPTGNLCPETFLIDVLNASDALVLVDEAYFEFSRHTMRPHMDRHPNLVILRTFSKAFSLAGMRVGYLLGHEDVVREIMKVRQPYSVNAFSQWVALKVFRERVVFQNAIRDIMRERDRIVTGLSELDGVEVFTSEANFVLFRVEHASALWRDLLHGHSVLIRDFGRTPGLEDCLRVTVGSAEDNIAFLEAMRAVLSARRASEILTSDAASTHIANGETGY